MKKRKTNTIVIISVLTLLVISGVGFGGYKYSRINKYNDLIKDANKHMDNSEYDKAIDLYKQSLIYKKVANIENSITLAKNLIEENNNNNNNNEYAKKIKDTIDMKIIEQQAVQKSNEEQENATQKIANQAANATSKITTTTAEDIVRKHLLKDSDLKTISQFDHEETVDGVKYFVIHVYDVVVDHTATRGWYFVNQDNGKIFDGTYGDLIPIN